jgi:hypothetical protein
MNEVAAPMYTVTELAEMLLMCARFACSESRPDAERPESLDPAGIDRRRSAEEIVREQLSRCRADVDAETLYEAALSEIAEELALKGLEVRHLSWRLALPLEDLAAKLNAMMYRNLERRVEISPGTLTEFVSDYYDVELTDADLARPKALTDRLNDEIGTDPGEHMPLSELIEGLLDRFGLDFSEEEREALDRKRSMQSVFEMLNKKRAQRRTNDGLVQYGRVPGTVDRSQSREMLDRLGGIDNAARGLAVKHVGDLFDVTAERPGGFSERYGIIDRVPEAERTGHLAGARAPVRVYRRTDNSLSMDEFSSPFDRMDAELEIYRSSEDAEYFDYRDVEEMMDDGWTLD